MKSYCQSCGMPLAQDPGHGGTNLESAELVAHGKTGHQRVKAGE